ncbi:MAG: RNA chaperone Hfq [Clostridiales bacterium]|nr:RNA chaperone Hfq [Clostridiales bacterium]
MQKTVNLQDVFLNRIRKDKLLVTMFLMNGFQLRGTVTGFDSFMVVLESEGKQQMIYKHAISTIVPARTVGLSEPEHESE